MIILRPLSKRLKRAEISITTSKKAVVFLLSCNLGEVIAIFLAVLLGWPVPLLATQILWINLITDTLPAISLGIDPGDLDVMKQKTTFRERIILCTRRSNKSHYGWHTHWVTHTLPL